MERICLAVSCDARIPAHLKYCRRCGYAGGSRDDRDTSPLHNAVHDLQFQLVHDLLQLGAPRTVPTREDLGRCIPSVENWNIASRVEVKGLNRTYLLSGRRAMVVTLMRFGIDCSSQWKVCQRLTRHNVARELDYAQFLYNEAGITIDAFALDIQEHLRFNRVRESITPAVISLLRFLIEVGAYDPVAVTRTVAITPAMSAVIAACTEAERAREERIRAVTAELGRCLPNPIVAIIVKLTDRRRNANR